jgi:hypothetical protein
VEKFLDSIEDEKSNKTNENYDLYFQNFNAVYNILLEYKKKNIVPVQLVVKLVRNIHMM